MCVRVHFKGNFPRFKILVHLSVLTGRLGQMKQNDFVLVKMKHVYCSKIHNANLGKLKTEVFKCRGKV